MAFAAPPVKSRGMEIYFPFEMPTGTRLLAVDALSKGSNIYRRDIWDGCTIHLATDFPCQVFGAASGLIGMAWLCIFGIIVISNLTFKRCSGLYFWAIALATSGAVLLILFRTLQLLLSSLPLVTYLSIMLSAGLIVYVGAEFAMIYARLSLLVLNPRIILFVKVVLSAEFLLLELPVVTMTLVVRWARLDLATQNRLWAVISPWWDVKVVGYAIVCIIVTCIFVHSAWKIFRSDATARAKKILLNIFGTCGLLIMLDSLSIGIWFGSASFDDIPGFYTAFLYSFKLLAEFVIINEISDLSLARLRDMESLNVEVFADNG